MSKNNILIRANRDQLYSMAAISSFGEETELIIDHKSYDPDGRTIRFAVPVRDSAPEQRLKDRHDNGYAYYDVNSEGHVKPLKEDEI